MTSYPNYPDNYYDHNYYDNNDNNNQQQLMSQGFHCDSHYQAWWQSLSIMVTVTINHGDSLYQSWWQSNEVYIINKTEYLFKISKPQLSRTNTPSKARVFSSHKIKKKEQNLHSTGAAWNKQKQTEAI